MDSEDPILWILRIIVLIGFLTALSFYKSDLLESGESLQPSVVYTHLERIQTTLAYKDSIRGINKGAIRLEDIDEKILSKAFESKSFAFAFKVEIFSEAGNSLKKLYYNENDFEYFKLQASANSDYGSLTESYLVELVGSSYKTGRVEVNYYYKVE